MILLIHDGKKVLKVLKNGNELSFSNETILSCLFNIAKKLPKIKIVWCRKEYIDFLDLDHIEQNLDEGVMWSHDGGQGMPFQKYVGYVDPFPFIKVKEDVKFPTWQMSSIVGAITSSTLMKCRGIISESGNFDYFLNTLAKLYMPAGLFCYYNSALLKSNKPAVSPLVNYKLSLKLFFRFTVQSISVKTAFLLFLCLFFFDKKAPFLSLFNSLFFRKYPKPDTIRGPIEEFVESVLPTIDVIIPTIGRKNYLYEVLKDLNIQSHLPKRVIIIEQNHDLSSKSELLEVVNENWNFEIIHKFIHRLGVCNARNMALTLVKSDWVFMNDDDNKISVNTIENTLKYALTLNVDCVVTAYPQPHEIVPFNSIHQSPILGSGNAFLKAKLLSDVKFDIRYEFGYGEDSDFGMQLRNSGSDIILVPYVQIIHLKAPFGGFRVTPELQWSNELIQPKPSPTIMLFKLMHETHEQYLRYKLIAFITFYKSSGQKLIFYTKFFNTKWDSSVKWAKILLG
jgi:hypothetical protein